MLVFFFKKLKPVWNKPVLISSEVNEFELNKSHGLGKSCTFTVQRNPACLGACESHGSAGGRLISSCLIQQQSNKYKILLRPFRQQHWEALRTDKHPSFNRNLKSRWFAQVSLRFSLQLGVAQSYLYIYLEAGGKGLLLTRQQCVSLLADSLKSRSKLFLTTLIEGKLQVSSI